MHGSAVTANGCNSQIGLHIEGFSGGGTGTAQRVTDSTNQGFISSLKVTVTGTDTSLAASDFYTLRHIIEAFKYCTFRVWCVRRYKCNFVFFC